MYLRWILLYLHQFSYTLHQSSFTGLTSRSYFNTYYRFPHKGLFINEVSKTWTNFDPLSSSVTIKWLLYLAFIQSVTKVWNPLHPRLRSHLWIIPKRSSFGMKLKQKGAKLRQFNWLGICNEFKLNSNRMLIKILIQNLHRKLHLCHKID